MRHDGRPRGLHLSEKQSNVTANASCLLSSKYLHHTSCKSALPPARPWTLNPVTLLYLHVRSGSLKPTSTPPPLPPPPPSPAAPSKMLGFVGEGNVPQELECGFGGWVLVNCSRTREHAHAPPTPLFFVFGRSTNAPATAAEAAAEAAAIGAW